MSSFTDSIKKLQQRSGERFGTRLLLPLFLITTFCFGYTEFRIQTNKPANESLQTSTSTQQKHSATDEIDDIPLATQEALPEVSVEAPASASSAPSITSTESTQSQVPNAQAVSNPQAASHAATSLQDTISQELYISLLHKHGSQ